MKNLETYEVKIIYGDVNDDYYVMGIELRNKKGRKKGAFLLKDPTLGCKNVKVKHRKRDKLQEMVI